MKNKKMNLIAFFLNKLLFGNRSKGTDQKIISAPITPQVGPKKIKKTVGIMDKTTRELLIQVDFAKNLTTVFSQYSLEENLAIQLDALCITIAKCIEDGCDPQKIYRRVEFYLTNTLSNYYPKEKRQTLH